MAYWTTYISDIINNWSQPIEFSSGEGKFQSFFVGANDAWNGEIIIPWVDAEDQRDKAMKLRSRDQFGAKGPYFKYIFQYNPYNQLRWVNDNWTSGDPAAVSQELTSDSGVGNSRILTIQPLPDGVFLFYSLSVTRKP